MLIQVLLSGQDHLRLRGKNFGEMADRGEDIGSPPLARKKSNKSENPFGTPGITSACAEKIKSFSPALNNSGDHLRLRGKNDVSDFDTPFGTGSPPLARKKFSLKANFEAYNRITSACAEKMW